MKYIGIYWTLFAPMIKKSITVRYNKELAKKSWEKQYDKEWRESEEGKKASEMTLPYSDRGEDCPPRIDEDETTFMASIGQCWEDYAYLYKEDYNGIYRWHIMKPGLPDMGRIIQSTGT